MFDPHVTSWTISPPRLSTEDKGKGTIGRQDLDMCYDLAVVKSDLDYLGVLLSFDGTLRDVHNVENQWLKQVSDLRGSE